MASVLATSDFSGTNTEKIDKLVASIIELRATLRLCYYLLGAGVPLLVMLMTFLVVRTYETSNKIDRLIDQNAFILRENADLKNRVERLEARPK